MSEIKELEEKLKLVMSQLKECFEISLNIKRKNPEHKQRVLKYWEDFGKHFLDFVRRREKETGEKVLGTFSLGSLFNLMR